MSKGIHRGSYVRLKDGSRGFIDPEWNEPQYDTPCFLGCRKDDCVEWANVKLDDGSFLFHVNECDMEPEPCPDCGSIDLILHWYHKPKPGEES